MSDFKAKMHQIRFRVGLRPRPRYSAPPDPLAAFKGPTSKGRRGREGWEGRGREGRGVERKGRNGKSSSNNNVYSQKK